MGKGITKNTGHVRIINELISHMIGKKNQNRMKKIYLLLLP